MLARGPAKTAPLLRILGHHLSVQLKIGDKVVPEHQTDSPICTVSPDIPFGNLSSIGPALPQMAAALGGGFK